MDEFFLFLERGLELVNKYGVPLTVVVLLIIFAVKYGPSLIKAHRSFMATSEETQRRLTASVESQEVNSAAHLLETRSHYTQFKDSHEVACRCGQHVCDVLEHVAEKLEIQDRVEGSVGAIRRELERAKTSL